ncbi:hypothetical protein [Paenibacillus sp. FSL R10-2734]|uniref:hypothetical protein n=1 Tax=Paenibacillus sp. FSL R10-2734 TaxID=2954691 RepID=UPI0030D91CDC
MKGENVWPISSYYRGSEDINRCANCGKPITEAREILTTRLYDGEFACCKECDEEHEEKGCPFDDGIHYRDMKY